MAVTLTTLTPAPRLARMTADLDTLDHPQNLSLLQIFNQRKREQERRTLAMDVVAMNMSMSLSKLRMEEGVSERREE